MTKTYTIGLSHHSIGRSREVTYTGTLAGAKRAATREFGDGFADHSIVIADAEGYPVAKRKISDRKWIDQ